MAAAPEPEPELPGEDFDFMKTAFPIEELRSLVKGGKVLVIGCGGGCDIVFATAVATYLRVGDSDTLFYTANTKGGLPTDKDVLTEVEGCSNILRPPAEVIPVDVNGPPTYGSTAVEQSMPRFADGSPYLVCLPSKSKDVEECTRENKELMVPQIRALGFDAIVGCDAGGDGLTGGMALEEGDVGLGRDVQMIGVLKACGLPFIQLVFGPGCDGESEEGAMRAALYKEQQAGTLRGVFPMLPLTATMRENVAGLKPTRTPMVCLAACDNPDQDGYTVVDRPHVPITPKVPTTWLTHVVTLVYSSL